MAERTPPSPPETINHPGGSERYYSEPRRWGAGGTGSEDSVRAIPPETRCKPADASTAAMNLLSHYLCSEPFAPAVRMGSILPDLLRLFARRPRPRALLAWWEDRAGISAGIRQMIEGVRFHQYVDSHFHRSELFLESSRELRVAMERAGSRGGLKRFFAAHLLTELYLDHLLLNADPDLSTGFYRLLEQERDGLATFVGEHPEVERGAFEMFLERILRDRFVNDYQNMQGVFYRTNRMLARMKQRTMDEPETEAVTLYLGEKKQQLEKGLLQFVQTMQKWETPFAQRAAKPDRSTEKQGGGAAPFALPPLAPESD